MRICAVVIRENSYKIYKQLHDDDRNIVILFQIKNLSL